MLIDVDPKLFGAAPPHASSRAAVEAFLPYVERKLGEGVRLADITRHMLGLFAGRPGARAFRRHLATDAVRRGAGARVVEHALGLIDHSSAAPRAERVSA